MFPLARVFVDSASHDISQFRIDGYNTVITPGFEYAGCDLAVVYGTPNYLTCHRDHIRLRNDIYDLHEGPILCIESSIFGRGFQPKPHAWFHRMIGRYRRPTQIHPQYRLAVGGGFGPEADFNNRNSPPDRWERLGMPILPYRSTGDHILVIGQTPADASLRGISMRGWLLSTVRKVRRHSDRLIVVRLHPNTSGHDARQIREDMARMLGVVVSQRGRPLDADLEQAWTTVTFSSGAAIDSLIAGIPAITMCDASLAYPVTSHDVADVEHPPMYAREQWLYDLAYAQWTPEEYADGTAWRHIEPAVTRQAGHELVTRSAPFQRIFAAAP